MQLHENFSENLCENLFFVCVFVGHENFSENFNATSVKTSMETVWQKSSTSKVCIFYIVLELYVFFTDKLH